MPKGETDGHMACIMSKDPACRKRRGGTKIWWGEAVGMMGHTNAAKHVNICYHPYYLTTYHYRGNTW